MKGYVYFFTYGRLGLSSVRSEHYFCKQSENHSGAQSSVNLVQVQGTLFDLGRYLIILGLTPK